MRPAHGRAGAPIEPPATVRETGPMTGTPTETDPTFDRRPWGTFQVLDEGDTFKAKRLTVDPGQRLSYQFHNRRAEHWVVVVGVAHVTLDDVVHEVRAGQHIEIGQGVKHRVENRGDGPMALIEVQTGDYFGEDDIVRLDDDYGRQDA